MMVHVLAAEASQPTHGHTAAAMETTVTVTSGGGGGGYSS